MSVYTPECEDDITRGLNSHILLAWSVAKVLVYICVSLNFAVSSAYDTATVADKVMGTIWITVQERCLYQCDNRVLSPFHACNFCGVLS